MRVERSLVCFILLASMACGGCGLIGGPEGTYTIDQERTRAGIEHYATQTLVQLVGEEKAKSNEIVPMKKKMMEETISMMEQISLELHLERGGKFHGQSKLGDESESFEGTWTLRGDKLETTTVSKNGKPLSSPKVETVHYEGGRLSFQDTEDPLPFIVLSKQ